MDELDDLAGIEYNGIPGASKDCLNAILRLLQFGDELVRARILSFENTHCIFLTNVFDDFIAIKSGFSSGYGGEGPHCFSYALSLLHSLKIEIEEHNVDETLIDRIDRSALTNTDIQKIIEARPKRPNNWYRYVLDTHEKQEMDGTLWQHFPYVIPFAIIDSRIIDLSLSFWEDSDGKLMTGYRRLEDIIRSRTGLTESSSKLFSKAFTGDAPLLSWDLKDPSEKTGRAQLFTGAYMAHRNPRSHRELEHRSAEALAEFLLLNHLYRLEREAISAEPMV